METVPLRGPAAFASTVIVTVPLPAPFEPAATEIHGAVLTAVQLQRAAALTAVVVLPPLDVIDWLVGDSVKTHGAAACETVTVWPAMMTDPVRATSVFAVYATDTVPLPLPLAPPVIVSQVSTALALHEQVVSAATPKLVAPASAVTD